MLKILRSGNNGSALFALSGRMEPSDLPELQRMLDAEAKTVHLTIDLREVRLVCREALRLLADCETSGIKLNNCPSYIRESLDAGGYKNPEP